MTILAIDPGWRTGIALSDGSSETLDFRKHDDIAAASCEFQRILLSFFQSEQVKQLVIERPFFHRIAYHTYLTHCLINAAHMVACKHDIPRSELSADQVRKTLLGRARRLKGESVSIFDRTICRAVEKKGFHPKTEHEADAAALLIAYAARNHIDLDHEITLLRQSQPVIV